MRTLNRLPTLRTHRVSSYVIFRPDTPRQPTHIAIFDTTRHLTQSPHIGMHIGAHKYKLYPCAVARLCDCCILRVIAVRSPRARKFRRLQQWCVGTCGEILWHRQREITRPSTGRPSGVTRAWAPSAASAHSWLRPSSAALRRLSPRRCRRLYRAPSAPSSWRAHRHPSRAPGGSR